MAVALPYFPRILAAMNISLSGGRSSHYLADLADGVAESRVIIE